MALIDKETIRAEIERRMFEDYNGPDTEQNETAQGVCAGILAFLDTLSYKPKDLDIPGFEGVKVHPGNMPENEPKCLWGNEPSEESCRYCSVWCSLRKPEPNSESSTNLDSKDDAVGLSIMLYLDTHVKHENSKVCGVPLKVAREWLRRHIGKDESQMAPGFFTKDIAASTDEPKRSLNLSDLLVPKKPNIPPVKEPFGIPSAGSGGWSETPPKYKLDVKPEQLIGLDDENAADKKAVKEIVKTVHKEVTRQVKEMVGKQPVKGLDLDSEIFAWQKSHANEDTAQVIAMTARHFAEWGAEQKAIEIFKKQNCCGCGTQRCTGEDEWLEGCKEFQKWRAEYLKR